MSSFPTEHFLDDTHILKVSEMVIGQKTIDILNRIEHLFVARSDKIRAPYRHLLPESVDMADIRVYSVEVVEADGVICARLRGEAKEVLAMIEIGAEPLIQFYPDGGEKTLTVKGDRSFVVFVRF